jgi:hypothetical protein
LAPSTAGKNCEFHQKAAIFSDTWAAAKKKLNNHSPCERVANQKKTQVKTATAMELRIRIYMHRQANGEG